MQDLVALGTGNSRLMKPNISPSTTLSELISMLNNGTFPYDIGPLNAAGISQQGTPLNKANLLSDVTAALLGGVNTPNEALALLKGLVDEAHEIAEVKSQLEIGSYVGTGTYGEATPTSISLSISAKIIFIVGKRAQGGIILADQLTSSYTTQLVTYNSFSSGNAVHARKQGNTIDWYATTNASVQLNDARVTYRYYAIG